MRPVGNAAGMKRKTADLDTLARTELAFNVEQDFVCFDIAMHIRDFDCLGVVTSQRLRQRGQDQSGCESPVRSTVNPTASGRPAT